MMLILLMKYIIMEQEVTNQVQVLHNHCDLVSSVTRIFIWYHARHLLIALDHELSKTLQHPTHAIHPGGLLQQSHVAKTLIEHVRYGGCT